MGSIVLLSSKLPLDPFKYVKTFVKGVRHVCLHQKGNKQFVFYSLIGDLPERILLGVIHLDAAEWRLRPGPVILEPLHQGNMVPSDAGLAPCTAVPQLRDPFFVPDSNEREVGSTVVDNWYRAEWYDVFLFLPESTWVEYQPRQ